MAVQVRYNFGACRKGVVGDFRRPLSTCECQLRLSPTMVGNTRVVAGRDQQRSTSTSTLIQKQTYDFSTMLACGKIEKATAIFDEIMKLKADGKQLVDKDLSMHVSMATFLDRLHRQKPRELVAQTDRSRVSWFDNLEKGARPV